MAAVTYYSLNVVKYFEELFLYPSPPTTLPTMPTTHNDP